MQNIRDWYLVIIKIKIIKFIITYKQPLQRNKYHNIITIYYILMEF